MAIAELDIQELYVAYFNRPADVAGMEYWKDALDANPDALNELSRSFSMSDEYRDTYAGMDNRAVVSEVYMNLFGREAESAGVDYWANLLDNKMITIDNVVTQIADGAEGQDEVAFMGKIAAATLFTERLDEPHEQAAYAGEGNDIAAEFLATIKDLSSAADALDTDVVDAWIDRIVDAHTAGETALVGVQTGADALPVV
ncbi:DUF4214 domain-containing protein [Massilia oculi]|uniref:DUF4214 domain-containing protein n=1 Tax=Massilia oculi TaxID=945844 RepID=UPI0028AC492A|nr:DUF4214 domain-containing protein [Massilia oculi]